MNRSLRCAAARITLAAGIAAASLAAQAQPADAASLYRELGERAGIAALMDDFVPRLKADPRLARFFEKTNLPELARQLSDQVCTVAGGPCQYRGANMKAAHADFDIRAGDFNALVEVLQDSMTQRGIAFAVQNRLLARLAPMHRDVVTVR